MKIIVAGSRTFTDYNMTRDILNNISEFNMITTIISGQARGADTQGEMWAASYKIPVKKYPANWTDYGKRAGYIRNEQMAKEGDMLIAFWDGKSKGTKHMLDTMRKMDKPSIVMEY